MADGGFVTVQHFVSQECLRAPQCRERPTPNWSGQGERRREGGREREGKGRGERRGERERTRLRECLLVAGGDAHGETWCARTSPGARNGGFAHGETFVSKECLRA